MADINDKTSMAFKPRARIMLQLGDQLIKNESIALLELIKNSYDADATLVNVVMDNIEDQENGSIIIEDNGTGMDFNTVKNAWMEPGSDYKEKIVLEQKDLKVTERSSEHKRLPLGEKGIGRFGVHKLGYEIELITRKEGEKEVYLYVDWRRFEKSEYLNQVKINIVTREPESFTGDKTGTKIVIKDLKNKWTRGMVRDIHRATNSLCSPFPFKTKGSFLIDLCLPNNQKWLEGLMEWSDIKSHALYHVKCEINNDKITSFKYEFNPWPTLDKLNSRVVDSKDDSFLKRNKMVHYVEVEKDGKKKKVFEPLDLSKFEIGEVKFEALIFDRTPKVLAMGVQDKKGFKEYLNSNGGIRVYRDGIRVYDYGEPGNDWLGLGVRRVNIPTKRISNNIVIAAVHVKRAHSSSLIEKTNREGFIENEAYLAFQDAILYSIGVIESFRNSDKKKLQDLYGPNPDNEPVTTSINKLRDTVETKVKNNDLKNEILNYVDRIENDYQSMRETLLKGAGAGLSLSIVIHEIDKIASELIHAIQKGKTTERTLFLARHLSHLVEGYTFVIKGSGVREESLVELIDQALYNIELRIESHKLEIDMDYEKQSMPRVKCAKRFVINNVMNIIDNSLWWLNYYDVQSKKIFITLVEEPAGYVSVVIADNGKGFSLPTEEIVNPFVSGKPDECGMGIGLHIVSETMVAQKGLLTFPDWGDYHIPVEYKKGAVVVLSFRK